MRVEHAFAALKGHFQSLRELRLRIRTNNDLHVTSYWITCCIILHNMVIHFEERRKDELEGGMMAWARREAAEWWEREDDHPVIPEIAGGEGQRFQDFLMQNLTHDHARGLHL